MWHPVGPFLVAPPRPVAAHIPDAIVKAIAASTEPTRACAARYHVAQSTVVRIRRGLLRAGAPRPWRRLSDEDVELMRVRHEERGWTFTAIVRYYGLPPSTVCEILKYRKR